MCFSTRAICLTIVLLCGIFLSSPIWGQETATSSSSEEEKELFIIAQRAFDDGFYDVALRYIEQFQEKFPQSQKRVPVKLLLGQCYFFKNQYLKAFEIFQTVQNESEFQDAIQFWLGETYLKGSDYAQAEKKYNQVLSVYPNSPYVPQAHYSLGWTYFEQKKFDLAREQFVLLTKQFPLHQLAEDAFFKTGESEYNHRAFPASIKTFGEFVAKYPQSNRHDQAYFYIAESNYYQDKYAEAIKYYLKAAEISSDAKLVVMAKVSTGWSHLKLKEFEPAKKVFAEALEMADNKNILADDILLGQGSLFSELGEHQQAFTAYDKLINNFAQSPRLAEAFLGKANSQYALKDYPGAITTYQDFLTRFGNQKDLVDLTEKAYFGIGWTYLKKGEIDSAINNFQSVVEKTSNKTVKLSALTQIGDAYQDAGKLDDALNTYDKILKNFPDSLYSDYIQYRQGITLLKLNRLDAAAISLQSLETNFPKSKYLIDSQYYLAVVNFKKNDWGRAKELISEFLKAAPENSDFRPEAQYILALTQFNTDDFVGAQKTFEKIINLYSDQDSLLHQAELGIAKSLHKQGQLKEALEKFRIIAFKYTKTETAFQALSWLGDYALENSEFPQAVEEYRKIVSQFPNHAQIPFIHYKIGQGLQAQGILDQALNEYKLIDDPRDKELYAKAKLAIAEIFSRELDSATAIQTYESIAANSPEMQRDAYLKIAQAYLKNQEYEPALNALQKSLQAPQGLSELNNAELQFYYADAHEQANKIKEAVEQYLRIPYLYPREADWSIKAYLRIAKLFEDQEDWENAKTTYQKIITFGQDESKYAQERIETIKANGH